MTKYYVVCVWSDARKSWFPNRRDTYVIHDFTKRNTLGNPHIIFYRRPMTIGLRGSILPKGGKVHTTN